MLLFALAVFADPTVTVTFTSTPLPLALKQLSVAVGKPLEASMALHNEVLMVRLKDAPRDEVLRRVAGLYLAEWVTQPDGTLILRPDAAQIRASQAQEAAKSLATLRGSLAYVAKRLKEQPERFGTLEAAKLTQRKKAEDVARKKAEETKNYDVSLLPSNAAEEAPGWRALGRLLPTLGERALLAIPPSHREVWAERNTRLQNAFPVASQSVLQRYREELSALKPEVDVVRVKVVLKRWERGEAHNASLIAYGPQGETVDTAFIRMANDDAQMKTPYSVRFAVPPAGEEKPLAIPAEAIEHGNLLHRQANPLPGRASLLAKWKTIFINPEKYEPTSWLPSLAYIESAKAMNLNLIGAPAELTGLTYDKTRAETPTQFLTRMRSNIKFEKNGWLTVENIERERRISRARGGELLREAVLNGGLSVDTAAKYAASTPFIWPFTTWVGDTLGIFFPVGGPRSVLALTHDDTLLRFWDGLGDPNRRLLRNGQTVDLSRLPQAAANELLFMLLHEERVEGIDPTERFANGIDGTLRLEIDETPIFTSWRASDGDVPEQVAQSAQEFGGALVKGNAWREISADAYRQRDRFRMGSQRTYRLLFDYGSVKATETMPEVFFDPASPVLNRLPESLQKAVNEARAKAQAEPPKASSGGGTPPPRR